MKPLDAPLMNQTFGLLCSFLPLIISEMLGVMISFLKAVVALGGAKMHSQIKYCTGSAQ